MEKCSVNDCEGAPKQRGMCWRHYSRMYRTGTTELGKRRVNGDPLDRFHARYDVQPNGCWQWNAKTFTRGYGSFRVGDKFHRSHRWAYEQFVGPIPDGLVIDHTCHNADLSCGGGETCLHRRCVNPDHLEAVSGQENLGRSGNYYGNKTRCKRGHEFTEANTMPVPTGRRCRACTEAKNRLSSLARSATNTSVQCRRMIAPDRQCQRRTCQPSKLCRNHQERRTE